MCKVLFLKLQLRRYQPTVFHHDVQHNVIEQGEKDIQGIESVTTDSFGNPFELDMDKESGSPESFTNIATNVVATASISKDLLQAKRKCKTCAIFNRIV